VWRPEFQQVEKEIIGRWWKICHPERSRGTSHFAFLACARKN
jgi:hypothetical protein